MKPSAKTVRSFSWFVLRTSESINTLDFDEAVRNRIVYIDDKLKIVAQELGINKPVSMHSARHTFAEMLYEESKDVRLVSN